MEDEAENLRGRGINKYLDETCSSVTQNHGKKGAGN
jgi:hypothetical protein